MKSTPFFCRILPEDEPLLYAAGAVHSAAWRASHQDVVSPEFLAAHTPERQTAFLRQELDKGRELYGAFFADTPVGIVMVDPNSGEISSLYVLPSRWNQGVGGSLFAFAQKRLRALSVSPWLSVLSSNARVCHFYEHRGFVFCGEERLLNEETGLRELTYRLHAEH